MLLVKYSFFKFKKNIGIKYRYSIMSDRGRREDFDVETVKKQKNTGDNKISADKIKEEVEKLSQKGTIEPSDFAELYKKYGDKDNIVDEVLRKRSKRYQNVIKQARKIADKIVRKYQEGKPLHEILEKMLKYKAENHWSDAEFDQFRKELSARLSGNRAAEIDLNQNLEAYRSRISKALGMVPVSMPVEEGLRIKDSEQGTLAEILSMWEKSASLHKSVFMLSLMYHDTDLVAMSGLYKREKHIASN